MKTRCPQCQSVCALNEALLQQASGMVRCGRCQGVFDALKNRCDIPPASIPTLKPAEQPAPVPIAPKPSPVVATSAPAAAPSAPQAVVPMNPAPRFLDCLTHLKSVSKDAETKTLFTDVFAAQALLWSRSAQALVASVRLRDTRVPRPDQLSYLLQYAPHYNRTKEAESARRTARLAAKAELYKSRLRYSDAKQAAKFPLPASSTASQPVPAAESFAPSTAPRIAPGDVTPSEPTLAAPIETAAYAPFQARIAPESAPERPELNMPKTDEDLEETEEESVGYDEDAPVRKRNFLGCVVRLGVFVLFVLAILQIVAFFRLPVQLSTPSLIYPLNALCDLPLNCHYAYGLAHNSNNWESALQPSPALNNPATGTYQYTIQISLKNTDAAMNAWPTLKLLYVSQDNHRYQVLLSPQDYLPEDQQLWPGLKAGQVLQFSYTIQLKAPLRYNSLQLQAQ